MVYDREKNYGSGLKKREYNFPLERIEPFFLKLFFSKKKIQINLVRFSHFSVSRFHPSSLSRVYNNGGIVCDSASKTTSHSCCSYLFISVDKLVEFNLQVFQYLSVKGRGLMIWSSSGSKGEHPRGPNSFIFMQFSAKKK